MVESLLLVVGSGVSRRRPLLRLHLCTELATKFANLIDIELWRGISRIQCLFGFAFLVVLSLEQLDEKKNSSDDSDSDDNGHVTLFSLFRSFGTLQPGDTSGGGSQGQG